MDQGRFSLSTSTCAPLENENGTLIDRAEFVVLGIVLEYSARGALRPQFLALVRTSPANH